MLSGEFRTDCASHYVGPAARQTNAALGAPAHTPSSAEIRDGRKRKTKCGICPFRHFLSEARLFSLGSTAKQKMGRANEHPTDTVSPSRVPDRKSMSFQQKSP